MKYVIDSKTYEKHIRDEVHLYGLLHQLAFLAGKVKDEEDMANLVETSKHYGEIAEKKFDDWLIPGRYLAFGDRDDLAELKAAELTPLTAVLKEHDAKIREKQRAASSNDLELPGQLYRPAGQQLHHFRQRLPYAGGRSL